MTGPRQVMLASVAEPAVAPGEVLVEIKAVGLCTLEQRVFRGARSEYPFLGGHEVGGVVVQSSSSHLLAEPVVAVSTFPRCGSCELCQSGMDNLCGYRTRRAPESLEPWGPGGLADYISAPSRGVSQSRVKPRPRAW